MFIKCYLSNRTLIYCLLNIYLLINLNYTLAMNSAVTSYGTKGPWSPEVFDHISVDLWGMEFMIQLYITNMCWPPRPKILGTELDMNFVGHCLYFEPFGFEFYIWRVVRASDF